MGTLEATKKKSGFEEEVALVIRGDDPAEVADRVAAVSKLGSWYYVEQEPDQVIIDTYLNTENRDLKGSSLRIRNVDGTDFVTLKGKNLASKGSPALRTEMEVEWPWQEPSVWDVAILFNMTAVQQRTTNRRVRNIYTGTKNKKLKAEMAIDEVTYNFGKDKPAATFYEVEIEKRGNSKYDTPDDIAKVLLATFPELQKWPNSKLSTGKILQIALGIDLNEEGVVTDESFDYLEILLDL